MEKDWNDLFIGKDEAYIMNRKKKGKSMLRKEGDVYVLDLFVRVPSSVAAPIVYTPMEVDATLVERESEDRVSLVLVIRERRHKMTWAKLIPRKGTVFPLIAKRAAKFIDQLGHNRVTLRCGNELAIEALAREIAQAHQEKSQTVPGRPPVGESQSNGIIERAVGPRCWSGQDTEGCTGASHCGQSPARRKGIVLVGGVCGVFDEQVRHRQGRKDTAAKTTRAMGQHTDSGVWRMDPVHARQTSERRKGGAPVPPRSVCWHAELVASRDLAIKTRSANIRRLPESEMGR